MKKPHQISINGLMWFLLFIFNNYFKMSRRLKHFSILSKAKSTCSLVCVAINEKRIKVSLGATAGQTPLRQTNLELPGMFFHYPE